MAQASGMGRPRIFYGWAIVAVAFVTMGVSFGVWYSFSVFLVAVVRDLGWSRADTSLAFSVFVIAYGLSGVMCGRLIQRFGLRRIMSVGAVFLALSLASCSLISAPWHYYLTFGVLTGVGTGSIGNVPSQVLVTRWFKRRVGLALGTTMAGIGAVGLFALLPINQYAISTLGWRNAYLVLALIVVLVVPPLCLLLVRERPEDIGLLQDGAAAPDTMSPARMVAAQAIPAAKVDRRWLDTAWTLSLAVRTKRFWALTTAIFTGMIASQVVLVHEVAYFTDLGRSAMVAASISGLVGLFSIPAKIGWGWASDRIGREWAFSLGTVLMCVGMVVLMALPGIPGDWPLYLFALTYAFGYAVGAGVNPAVSADLFQGKGFPTILSFAQLFGQFGSALGPWFAAYIFDVGHSYMPAFVVATAAAVISAVAVWIAGPRQIRPVSGRFGAMTRDRAASADVRTSR